MSLLSKFSTKEGSFWRSGRVPGVWRNFCSKEKRRRSCGRGDWTRDCTEILRITTQVCPKNCSIGNPKELQNNPFNSGTSVVLLEDSSMTSHSFTTLTGGPCANICKTLNENEGGWNATGTKLGREPTHWTLASGFNASTLQMWALLVVRTKHISSLIIHLQPPEGNQIALVWDGSPTDFNSSVSYRCESEDTYFE